MKISITTVATGNTASHSTVSINFGSGFFAPLPSLSPLEKFKADTSNSANQVPMDVAQALIADGRYPNAQNAHGICLLQVAAACNRVDWLTTLLQQGADVMLADRDGHNALHSAAMRGHTANVALLADAINQRDKLVPSPEIAFSETAGINAEDNKGNTALHWAALNDPETVTALLDRGAAVMHWNKDKLTPLAFAELRGHHDIVRTLQESFLLRVAAFTYDIDEFGKHLLEKVLETHIDPNRIIIGREIKATPLHIAAYHGWTDLVNTLLERRANVNARTMGPIYKAGWRSDKNSTPLHLAAWQGNLDVVESLLKRGADVNALTDENETALHGAAFNGSEAVLQYLLGRPGIKVDIANIYGHKALLYASRQGHEKCAQLLMQAENAEREAQEKLEREALGRKRRDLIERVSRINGAMETFDRSLIQQVLALNIHPNEITTGKNRQYTLLHIAAHNGWTDEIKSLINRGADVNAKTTGTFLDSPNGWMFGKDATPLHFAAYRGHLPCVEALVESNADVDALTEGNDTPLHGAARLGHHAVVQYLLSKEQQKKNAAAANVDGDTPLYLALKYDQFMCLRHFCGNTSGMSSLHVAALNNDMKSAQLLCDGGADPTVKNKNGRMPYELASDPKLRTYLKTPVDEKLQKETQEKTRREAEENAKREQELKDRQEREAKENAERELKEKADKAKARLAAIGTLSSITARPEEIDHMAIRQIFIHKIDPNSIRLGPEKQYTPLHIAACNGWDDIVDGLLSHGANVDARTTGSYQDGSWIYESNATPLHFAAYKGHWDCVEKLLNGRAAVSALNNDLDTPLHGAAFGNHERVVRHLLYYLGDEKWQPNKYGQTPLNYALNANHTTLVNLLCKNEKGRTPLHIAAATSDRESAEILIKRGEDPTAQDVNGNQPYQLAGTPDLYNYLYDELVRVEESQAREAKEKADKERAEREARERQERAAKERADKEKLEGGKKGLDPIEQLLRTWNVRLELADKEKAEREAKEKAEREAREKTELEELDHLTRMVKERKEREILEMQEKARQEARERAKREREARELQEREAKEKAEREMKEQAEREAAEKARQEAEARAKQEQQLKEWEEQQQLWLEVLAKKEKEREEREAKEKAEREEKERAEKEKAKRKSSLHDLATEGAEGVKEMERLLPTLGAAVNQKNGQGETALHIAAREGNVAAAQLLLRERWRVQWEQPNANGCTPFYTALLNKREDIALLLIAKGAALATPTRQEFRVGNQTIATGSNALHIAAQTGSSKLVSALLERQNVDTALNLRNGADGKGHTPLQEALRAGKEDIACLLMKNAKCKFLLDFPPQPGQPKGKSLYAWAAENLRPDSPFRTALTQRSDLGAAVRNEDHQLLRHSLKHRIHPQPVEHQYAPNKTLLHLAADKLKAQQPNNRPHSPETKAWVKSVGRLLMRADGSHDRYKDNHPLKFLDYKDSGPQERLWEKEVSGLIQLKLDGRMRKESHLQLPPATAQQVRQQPVPMQMVQRSCVWGIAEENKRLELRQKFLEHYQYLYSLPAVRPLMELMCNFLNEGKTSAFLFYSTNGDLRQIYVPYAASQNTNTVGLHQRVGDTTTDIRVAGNRTPDAGDVKENLTSASLVAGTTIHELCHGIMNMLFKNGCNPYPAASGVNPGPLQVRFKDICNKINMMYVDNQERGTLHRVIQSVFDPDNYSSTSHDLELIVRVPQIIAEYSGLGWNEQRIRDTHFPQGVLRELWDYYHDAVLPRCEAASREIKERLDKQAQLPVVNNEIRGNGGNGEAPGRFGLSYVDWIRIKSMIEATQHVTGHSKK